MNSEDQSDGVKLAFSLRKKIKTVNERLKNLWKQHVNGEKLMVATNVLSSTSRNFPIYQTRKIEHKDELCWARRPLSGVGVFHAKGWGVFKKFVP